MRRTLAHGGAALALAGGITVVAGSALPWVGIGGVNRSVFTLARVANEMNVFERRSQRFALYLLLSTPVLVPLGLLLLSVGWRRSCAAVLSVCGLIVLASGGMAVQASISRGLGPIVTAVGGIAALFGSCLLAVCSRPQQQE